MDKTNDSDIDLKSIAQIDRLIHEPSRLVILSLLAVVEEADFLFALRQTGLTRGNLSAHTSKLEAAGLIHVRKEFIEKIPRTVLSLTETGRIAFEVYRQHLLHTLSQLGE